MSQQTSLPTDTVSTVKYVSARVALNMRTGPSTDFDVITTLRRGTAVEIIEDGPWPKVRENGNVGFVSGHFLSKTKPGPLPKRTSSTSSGVLQTGMNINPDVHGLDLDQLKGLHWVRFVYKAEAKNRDVHRAFNEEYQQLIQSYNDIGVKCLIILNQETVGNVPKYEAPTNLWNQYAQSFAQATKTVATLCKPFGDKVAYQIWNEEDSINNPSAIGVKSENFAPLLDQAATAIRQVTNTPKIIIGGLNSGPSNATNYVRQVQASLGGRLPVDALAIHPYGRYVHTDFFYEQRFGTLQEGLKVFKQAFPHLQVWITEIGVAGDNPIGPEHYQNIANYMREFVNELADNQTQHVPVLIWFAWTDMMHNAGIKTTDGRFKPHVGDAYREMVAKGKSRDK